MITEGDKNQDPEIHLRRSPPGSRSKEEADLTAKPRLRLTERFSGATRRLAVSPAAAKMWRFIARGTEPGHAKGLLVYWQRWEHLAHKMWPTTLIPRAPYGLLEIRVGPYQGKPLTLPDQTEIREGTIVAELHCNNKAILNLVRKNEVSPFSACREDLRAMAAWARESEAGQRIEACFGVTILAQGAARLGFMVNDHPPRIRDRLDRIFMTGLLLIYGVDGLDRLVKGTTLRSYPQGVWMSRRDLLRRYGDREPRRLPPMRLHRVRRADRNQASASDSQPAPPA
jgi:YkoP domain